MVFNGAQVTEVDEPLKPNVLLSEAILQVEFEAFPEPKTLGSSDLRRLVDKYGSFIIVAQLIRASEAFVRQNLKALT